MTKTKKDKITLSVKKRTQLGKGVKKLRKDNIVPANIYGEEYSSQAISVPYIDLIKIIKTAGETQVVYLTLGADEIPTIIHNVQKHPVSDSILHVDFRKVSLKKKIETKVPLVFIGESEAVEKKRGDLLTLMDEIVIKALPDKIPTNIEVSIEALKEVDDSLYVKDIPTSPDYEIVSQSDELIVKIAAHKEEVIEALPSAETQEGEQKEESTDTKEGEQNASDTEQKEDK